MIHSEGKQEFCKTFLNDLKQLKNDKRISLNRKRLLMKEIKQYCFQKNPSNDKKFLASLDKKIRKEKKKMDSKLANNEDYGKLDLDDNLYARLNDTDFLTSLKMFMAEGTKNPLSEVEDTNNEDDGENEDIATTTTAVDRNEDDDDNDEKEKEGYGDEMTDEDYDEKEEEEEDERKIE